MKETDFALTSLLFNLAVQPFADLKDKVAHALTVLGMAYRLFCNDILQKLHSSRDA